MRKTVTDKQGPATTRCNIKRKNKTRTDRLRPAETGSDQQRPAQTSTDRLRPAQPSRDRLRPAETKDRNHILKQKIPTLVSDKIKMLQNIIKSNQTNLNSTYQVKTAFHSSETCEGEYQSMINQI